MHLYVLLTNQKEARLLCNSNNQVLWVRDISNRPWQWSRKYRETFKKIKPPNSPSLFWIMQHASVKLDVKHCHLYVMFVYYSVRLHRGLVSVLCWASYFFNLMVRHAFKFSYWFKNFWIEKPLNEHILHVWPCSEMNNILMHSNRTILKNI